MNKKLLSTFGLLSCFCGAGFAQTAADRAVITSQSNQEVLQRLAQSFETTAAREKAAARAYARQNNLPLVRIKADGSREELIRIDENGVPIYFTNTNADAAKSTRANYLNSGGGLGLSLNGQNMIVGVWDAGGVRTTHQELNGRVTIKDTATATGDNHSTHVGGTIAASGVVAQAKGMAPQASIHSYEWNSDLAEATSAAGSGLLISNHSYGYGASSLPDWYFGAYLSESGSWDNVLFNAPYYLACKSAGNDGTSAENGTPLGGATTDYDKLSGVATAKNVLVVANTQDAVIDSQGNLSSVVINATSSQGPTDDLRIKPDISGNGTTLYSSTATSNTAYGTYTGTSMATPNVAGTLTLVNQHFKNITGSYMLGAALRGLTMHTADDAGQTGPDAVFGWGLLNAKRMVETINNRNTTAAVENRTLTNGKVDTIYINSDGATPILASISWYDRPGATQTSAQINSTTVKRLVNDLDLRFRSVSNGTVYLPWALTSRSTNSKQDNNSDNFELVAAGIVPAGQYACIISHKGSLTGGNQAYTLIITGKSSSPTPCNAPTNLAASNISSSSAVLSWASTNSSGINYRVEYQPSGAATWTLAYTGTGTTVTLSNLAAASGYNWRVRTECTASSFSAYTDATFTTPATTGTCNAPTNLTSASVTSSTAQLSWSASSSATASGYTVEYKTAAATTWALGGTTTGTSLTLAGLSSSTSYQWRIKTTCGSSSVSNYATASFTSAASSNSASPATACVNAYESNNTLSTAYAISTNTSYQATIGTSGDLDYYKVTIPGGSYTVSLTNLTHNVDLKIQNASGTTLAASQNNGTASERITGNFTSGTYYIQAYASSPSNGHDANNCYTLTMASGMVANSEEHTFDAAVDNSSSVQMYPNPVMNQLHVRLNQTSGSSTLIHIMDLMGKDVLLLKGAAGENRFNVSGLASGSYILQIETPDGIQRQKFTKL